MYVFTPKGVYLIVKSIFQRRPITTWKIHLSNNQQLTLKENWEQKISDWYNYIFVITRGIFSQNINQWHHFQINYLFKNQNIMQQSATWDNNNFCLLINWWTDHAKKLVQHMVLMQTLFFHPTNVVYTVFIASSASFHAAIKQHTKLNIQI
jgi:hypothetical protein